MIIVFGNFVNLGWKKRFLCFFYKGSRFYVFFSLENLLGLGSGWFSFLQEEVVGFFESLCVGGVYLMQSKLFIGSMGSLVYFLGLQCYVFFVFFLFRVEFIFEQEGRVGFVFCCLEVRVNFIEFFIIVEELSLLVFVKMSVF